MCVVSGAAKRESSGGAVGLRGCGHRLGEVAQRGAESSEPVGVEVVRVDDQLRDVCDFRLQFSAGIGQA
jgi:hypothetical protein